MLYIRYKIQLSMANINNRLFKYLTFHYRILEINYTFYTPVEDVTYYGITRGGRAGDVPILCPEHISKTMLATVMKFHG